MTQDLSYPEEIKATIFSDQIRKQSLISADFAANIVHQIESLGIRVREAGGEVWYDISRNITDPAEKIKLGLLSGKVQQNKSVFIDYLWKRDKFDESSRKTSKDIISGMIGNKGIGSL